jgi:hypothetical protein
VNTLTAYPHAFGECAACGAEVKGSRYWVGAGPVAMHFVEGGNLPLCGAKCSQAYYMGARSPATKEQKNGGNDDRT